MAIYTVFLNPLSLGCRSPTFPLRFEAMSRPERQTDQRANKATAYLGAEGTRPYAGAGWYYAEYRDRVSAEFIALLAEQLGWSTRDRVLDVGAGPGQLSLLIAPFVAEVVAIEPEPDMLVEGERRAAMANIGNVRFVAGSSDDLPALRSPRVLEDLSAMIDEANGAIAFVTPRIISIARLPAPSIRGARIKNDGGLPRKR